MKHQPGCIQLRSLPMKEPVYGIGLMSGTSVDGVDAALVRIDTRDEHSVQVEEFIAFPIPISLREQILESMQPKRSHVDTICQLNFEAGELFAKAAKELIHQSHIKKEKIKFIGSHGQTLYHIPQKNDRRKWHTPSTLQIGDGCIIAERTGIQTVSDFRIRDMAAGGTGAPLIPFFDAYLFANHERDVFCQNIGGIANCTLMKKDGSITAFDSGPGNMVMDALMNHFYDDKRYDKNGDVARSGNVNQDVLQECLNHPYFKMLPPKATGHEDFGQEFVSEFLAKEHWKPEDALATACELTAQSMVSAYRDFVFSYTIPKEVIMSGGGTKNTFLMERLQNLCPELQWKIIDEFGIPSDAKEAAGFALLAFAALHHIPSNIPSVTGASNEVVLGKISR